MKVCVIGGGASGLVAAVTAAERGNEVTLCERQARVGRKLMSTGNGRCNLTNMNCSLEHYHGADAAFIRPALDAFGPNEAREFFGQNSMEGILRLINQKDEGGEGRSDEFVLKYAERQVDSK